MPKALNFHKIRTTSELSDKIFNLKKFRAYERKRCSEITKIYEIISQKI